MLVGAIRLETPDDARPLMLGQLCLLDLVPDLGQQELAELGQFVGAAFELADDLAERVGQIGRHLLTSLVVETEKTPIWGGSIKLKNGWTLALPDMPAETKLPITVNAKKLGGDDE